MKKKKRKSTNGFNPEMVSVSDLKPHPRNYREHPEDQLDHIVESIKEHGIYRNILIARDGTILAGHGVVLGAEKYGLKEIPVMRLNLDPDEPRALKVLAADNEINRLAEIDDRALTEILKEVKEFDPDGLLGSGFDEAMLANLLFVTRAEHEIKGHDEAAHWVGMPGYESSMEHASKIVVSFRTDESREDFLRKLKLKITEKTKATWWPPEEREDPSSIRFETAKE